MRLTIRIALASVLAATWLTALAKTASPLPQPVTLPSCSWDRPGHEPFMGDVVKAVDFYSDIPPDVRARLQERMAKRDYDDMVSITRDSITGKGKYGTTIRDMHFGGQRVCRSVTRESWTPSMQERGLVYCEGGQCILVPTVCRNVSRITRAQVSPAHAAGAPEPDTFAGVVPIDAGPSFVAPDVMRGPLASGGPVSTDPQMPIPLTAQPDIPGTTFATTASPSGSDSIPVPHAFVWPFASPIALPPGFVSGSPSLPGDPPLVDTGTIVPPSVIVPTPVPEPETWGLMLTGLAALMFKRCRAQWHLRAGAASRCRGRSNG